MTAIPAGFKGAATRLTVADVEQVSAMMGAEPRAIWAVATIEAAAHGFLKDGRPDILFESRVFRRLTKHEFDASNPDVSSAANPSVYGAAGAHQYDRLEEAMCLARTAALESASWGMFQILGENWQLVGFSDIDSFIAAMCVSEAEHLLAFANYCRGANIETALQNRDWLTFAKGWNPGNAQGEADKIAAAYDTIAWPPPGLPAGPVSSPPPSATAQSDVIVDLYHGDGPIDFAAMKAAGIEAVILKCTEGRTFADPTFASRSVDAAAAGLLVGAYHFFSSTSSGPDQNNWFLQHAGAVPVLAVDFEPDLTNADRQETVAAMVADLHTRTGRWPVLYTGRWLITDSDARLAQCPLWLANWNTDPNPPLPPGWSTWTFWQYTRTGAVDGVPGACDRSRFAGTVGELHDWWHQTVPGTGVLTSRVKALQALAATHAAQLVAAAATADEITAQLKTLAAAVPGGELL